MEKYQSRETPSTTTSGSRRLEFHLDLKHERERPRSGANRVLDSRPGHLFDDVIAAKSFQFRSLYSGDPNEGLDGIVPRVGKNVCKLFHRTGKQQM